MPFKASTFLLLMLACYSTAVSARYVQADPMGLAAGSNVYLYARANPLRLIDPTGLSSIVYNGGSGTLDVVNGSGQTVGSFPAANNAQTGSRGPWAPGTYDYAYHTTHPDDSQESAFGSNGNFVFKVPGCVGCGVHSGRAHTPDLAGRSGVQHATNGCIRTTDDATNLIRKLIEGGDPLTALTVRH